MKRKKKVDVEYCGDCDGCGWVEGGKALKTICKTCNGNGVVPIRTPASPSSREGRQRTMSDELYMKYFVLKPSGKDWHGKASRAALEAYEKIARESGETQFAEDLRLWRARCEAGLNKP